MTILYYIEIASVVFEQNYKYFDTTNEKIAKDKKLECPFSYKFEFIKKLYSFLFFTQCKISFLILFYINFD